MARNDIDNINEDRKEMLRSIALLYAFTYPDFVSDLSESGLTAEEIGLCVLYLIGYSLKEMDNFLSAPSILHINLDIRRKLDLPTNGIKLKTKLKEMFEEHYHQA